MTNPSGQVLPGTTSVNEEQREFWADTGPRLYTAHGVRFEAMAAPFGTAMLDAIRLQPGDRVLDVGCGHGTTTIEAAERVAPSGHVVGLDISATMLEPARRRVAAAGRDNIDLVDADAQVHPFEAATFDVVISRLGMMFFDDPAAAFGNFAHALRPGGRLAFVAWQDPLKSEWIAVALGAAVAQLGQPPDLGEPGAPGPWAFADGDRLTRLLHAGGFRDVKLDSVTRPQRIADDAEDAVAFIRSLPETQQLFAGASEHAVAAAIDALRAAFAPYAGPQGVVMDSTAWLVTAQVQR